MKVTHDHKCQICGKSATKNLQQIWISWEIDNDGLFNEEDRWAGNENDFYCDKCYEKEIN